MERKETEKIDVTKYVGTQTEIVLAQYKTLKYGKVIFLQTAVIPLKDGDKLPNDSELTATKILSLFEDKDGNAFIGIDSKTDKFLKVKKINVENLPEFEDGLKIPEIERIKVICQKNESGFLEIA